MLPDEEYAVYGDPKRPHSSKRWTSMVLAWSAFGKHLTGLPIDFQIQQSTHANETEKGRRGALLKVCDFEPPGPACKHCGCSNCDSDCVSRSQKIFDLVEGLIPVDPKDLVEFEREMNGKVIPELVTEIRRRVWAKE